MEVRKVSSKAQLTLPKEFSGKLVSIEKLSEGVLQIKSGEFIPDSERIFHTQRYRTRLETFDQWMETHDLQETDVEHVAKGKKS
jgi:bifunctional DNA-binding transcriptional regulator/antitoxin component of YhaV-PrlF toxin-antitoxin module